MINGEVVEKMVNHFQGNNILVALLRTHGKLSVPTDLLMELVDYEQKFPTDFISRNGSLMRISHSNDGKEFYFELAYIDDPIEPNSNTAAHVCVRRHPDNGEIQYSDTRPEWAVK